MNRIIPLGRFQGQVVGSCWLFNAPNVTYVRCAMLGSYWILYEDGTYTVQLDTCARNSYARASSADYLPVHVFGIPKTVKTYQPS